MTTNTTPRWTVNGPLTTATAIAPLDSWQAAVTIQCPSGLAQRAAYILGHHPFEIRQTGPDSSSFRVGLAAPVGPTPIPVAQAAAEAIARSVAHVVAALEA